MDITDTLRGIDYNALDISDYSRQYIMHIIPHMDYYARIFRATLNKLVKLSKRPLDSMTVVDYGGGHGFLSLMAKQMGAARVIYIDNNPKAAQAVQAVAAAAGIGPDVVLTGDSDELRRWCTDSGVRPDALVGTDVIEHIYRLEDFFADVYAVNPAMPMVFTTASNPFNPIIRKRLHKIMLIAEEGDDKNEGFRRMRQRGIQEAFPTMSKDSAFVWGMLTQGLTIEDSIEMVRTKGRPPKNDGYNTCDPYTGNWTERILPISEYRSLIAPYNASLRVSRGFYNSRQPGLKGVGLALLNAALHLPCTAFIAPFIFLECSPHKNQ